MTATERLSKAPEDMTADEREYAKLAWRVYFEPETLTDAERARLDWLGMTYYLDHQEAIGELDPADRGSEEGRWLYGTFENSGRMVAPGGKLVGVKTHGKWKA